jgi:membrane protease subunit HflC
MKRNRLTITIAAILILIFGSLLFIYQVRQSEVAVVTTFGKVSDGPTKKPGAHLKLPWPIQKVYKLDQRIQNFEGAFEEAKLSDEFMLFVQVYTGWRIENPALFFPKFQNGSISEAEKTLGALVQSAKHEVVTRHPFTDFISADKKQTKLAQIEDEMLQKVREQVRDYGIEVKFVQIKKLGLPEEVTKNVFALMQAERERLSKDIQSEGEKEASDIRSSADSAASALVAEATARASAIRGSAEAEALKSLEVLQQNPELAKLNFKLQALELMLKEKTTLILDQGTPPLDLLRNLSNTNADTGRK